MNPASRAAALRLDALARRWPLVHAASPLNWGSEVARLTEARRLGLGGEPRFVYPQDRPDPALPARLSELAAALDHDLDPLGPVARELADEFSLILAVGSPSFVTLARRRFASSAEADLRARRWASLPLGPDDDERVRSDDPRDPRSLLSAVRALLSSEKLPARVEVRPSLASLAATGDGLVLVAPHRKISPRVARRTALHEVLGHVAPWWQRSSGAVPPGQPPSALDREEGEALRVEQRAGLLDDARRKELGLRHVAACMAHDEEPFGRIVDCMEDMYAGADDAVRLAARALRGGGLGRERVYLPALWAEGPARGSPDRS